MGKMRELCESQIADAGNVKEGVARFAKKFVNEVMEDKSFKPSQVSIREMFDATVLAENPNLDLDDRASFREAVGHSQFPYMTKELISREVLPAYDGALGDVTQLVTEMDTNRPDYEYIAGFRAITSLPRVKSGQNYPSAEMQEKNVRCQIAKFGEILEIEKEMVLSDQTGQILDRARQGGDLMGQHRHQFIIETMMDGARTALEESTSTALVYGTTAQTVYSNDHSTTDGQTNDNLAASSAIGTASMDTVYNLLSSMKDERGRYINNMPRFVVVHPARFRTAWALCSDLGLASVDSANRGTNFYGQKLALTAIQSPYVGTNSGGATTDWYVGDMPKEIVWLWYWKPGIDRQGVDSDAAFERDVIARFKYFYAGGVCLRDYRYICRATA